MTLTISLLCEGFKEIIKMAYDPSGDPNITGIHLYSMLSKTASEWDLNDIYQLEKLTQLITHICGGISMFGVGCVISVKDFQRKETRLAKGLCIGLFLQTLIQPLAGFLLAILLNMTVHEALAMVLVASAPSASYASVLSFWGEGNVALR